MHVYDIIMILPYVKHLLVHFGSNIDPFSVTAAGKIPSCLLAISRIYVGRLSRSWYFYRPVKTLAHLGVTSSGISLLLLNNQAG